MTENEQKCYMCGAEHPPYPYHGKMLCPNCLATLVSLSKAYGYSVDDLIEYFEPQREEIEAHRAYWQNAMRIIEECADYVYDDVVYSDVWE